MKPAREAQAGRSLLHDHNLHIIFSITLTAVMGVAGLTPAFPRIIRELNVPPEDIGLLITAFTVPGVFLTPILGVLADRFGRKQVLAPSLFLFASAGGACALTGDFHHLLLLRLLQGTGAAALPSINVTLIGDLYSGGERDTAIGYNASVLSIGTASYPAIGGLLAAVGWQYPFLLSLFALPVGLLVLFTLDSPEVNNREQLGGYLRGVWRIMYHREVAVLALLGLSTFIILYGSYLTYFPFLLNHRFQASAPLIGLMMSCMSVTTALTSSQLGRLTKRCAKETLIRIAFSFYALALFLIPLMPALKLLLLPVILLGIGNGINIPCIQTLRVGLAPLEYRAAFMAVNGMILRLGQTLGPLFIGFFFVLRGTDGAFFAGGACALFMLAIFALVMRNDEKSGRMS